MAMVQHPAQRGMVPATKKASLANFVAGRKALFDAMKTYGLPYPANATERGLVMRCLGAMVTKKHFGAGVPPAIMSLPVLPGHDDKEAMWDRINCDERIFTPIEHILALKGEGFETIRKDLKDNQAMSSLVCVVQHWRCNSVTYWPALVEDLDTVIKFMTALGYPKQCKLMLDLMDLKASGASAIKELPPGWAKTKNQEVPGDPGALGTLVAPEEKQDKDDTVGKRPIPNGHQTEAQWSRQRRGRGTFRFHAWDT